VGNAHLEQSTGKCNRKQTANIFRNIGKGETAV